jgi:NAD-dependent dihydropyrimidine dehydrogenase PreA subunit
MSDTDLNREEPVAEATGLVPDEVASAEGAVGPPSYERSDRGAQKRSRMIRLGVLGAGLVTITGIGIAHQYGAIKPVGVDALCPFGGIETLWSLLTTGANIQRIAASSVVLLGIVLIVAVIFRRAFCGYICPLGALQEFFGKIRAVFTRKPRLEMPAAIDRPARWLKYVVLVVFTVWTWQAAALVIRPYDPWVAWMHLSTAEVFAEFGIGLAVLGVSLVGSVFYDRFFCKYLCPMGAFLGAISWFSMFRVNRTESTCIDCRACDKACPVNITVSKAEVVNSPECINCNECVNVCPVADTLTVENVAPVARGWSMRPTEMLVMVSALIVVALAGTTVAGAFTWTMNAPAAATPATGATISPDDIKGSMTFEQIAKATGIPAAAFEKKFGVSAAEMTKPIKDIAGSKGFDVHTDVREFVKQQLEAKAGSSQAAPVGGQVTPASAPAAPAPAAGAEED